MMRNYRQRSRATARESAFTIIELLIAVVVIAVLATIAFVAYQGAQDRAEAAALESDLTQASKQLSMSKVTEGSFPSGDGTPPESLTSSTGTTFEYTSDGTSFCLSATKGSKGYHITSSGSPKDGVCPGHSGPNSGNEEDAIADGSFIQDITSANCPDARTRAVDARDNHAYWVQKLADGNCWMLTNLAYAGGGTNTYGDVKTLANGEGDDLAFTAPRYYIPPGSNVTVEPVNPSVSTNGTGQYGYLYNWCGAMGGQATAACAEASTPPPDKSATICPAGWHLPGWSGGNEFKELNDAVNDGSGKADTGLRSVWLAQYSGLWYGSFNNQDKSGDYWLANAMSSSFAFNLKLAPNIPYVHWANGSPKSAGLAVRCVAA